MRLIDSIYTWALILYACEITIELDRTMTSTKRRQLSLEQKEQLEQSIMDFLKWLRTRIDAKAAEKYETLTFPRPTAADWIMKAKGQAKGEVFFNTYISDKCSFEYFQMVVLHECFHLFVQDVPNKLDAKRLKDDFGNVMMKLLDIEADYYIAMYYKERRHASLIDIFALNYEGSELFGDPTIRVTKFERFIGSVLSIANAYFKSPGRERVKERDLYLPNVGNIPVEESMHVLVVRNSYFLLSEIRADIHDLIVMKTCYTKANGMTVKEYIDKLLKFACKALNRPIPNRIYKQFIKL
jgi:hypothetical protein